MTTSTTPQATYVVPDTSTGNNTITVSDGPPTAGFQTTEVTIGSGTTILANKTKLQIQGESSDNVVLANPDPATGLQSVVISGGDTIDGSASNTNSHTADITVPTLDLAPNGAIGVSRALQTQVDTFHAFDADGDINITNGVTAPVTLTADIGTEAQGSVTLTNNGTVNDTDGAGGIFTTGGAINITANGATADFNTGSGGVVNADGGSVNLTVGRDINLGDSAGVGPVTAGGGMIWSAGRNVTLNANASIINNSSGLISITAGTDGGAGNITMLTAPGSQNVAPEIVNQASTGSISLTALHGGTLTLDSTGTTAVQSTNGFITLAADAIVINKAVNAGSARVTVSNATAGQAIRLGSGNAPGVLGLTMAELTLLSAGVVQVGSSSAGNITITAPITPLAHAPILTLENAGSITQTALGSLDVANLAISSAGPVTLTNPYNVLGPVAISSTNAVTINNDTHPLNIGFVDNVFGISTTNAAINLTADSLGINQPVTAGTGIVTIAPFSASQNIALGSGNATGTLGLLDTELGEITASVLRIDGNATNDSSNITVSGAVSRHTGYNTLSLNSFGNFSQTAALAVANLALSFDTGITMTTAGNSIDTLAFANVAFGVAITDGTSNALTIGAVDGLTSSYNTGTTTTITTGGNLTFAAGLYTTGSTGVTTLTSTGGQILDNAGGAVDITAPTLALSASTGIGTSTDALQTQVATLNAVTAAGGIFIDNGGAAPVTLSIGNGGGGIRANSFTSGDIVLTNNGTIDSFNSGDIIDGPGNVTVKAVGGNADLNFGGQASSVSVVGVNAGLVDLEAGHDITLGNSSGLGFVRSLDGSIRLVAGRNLTLDANAIVQVQNGHGGITATAGGNITMTTAVGTFSGAPEFFTAGGAIALTTGAGGTLTLASTGTDAVHSNGGNIALTADQMTISQGVNAGAGNVLIQPVTAGEIIDLGGTSGTLNLNAAALNEITATTLTVGSANVGEAVVDGTVNPQHVTNLVIESGADVAFSSGSVSVGTGTLTIEVGQDGIGGDADLSTATITAGAIHVVGGVGDDQFVQGAYADTLTGGAGPDVFRFGSVALTAAELATPAIAEVTDYDQGSGSYAASEGDRIDLSALLSTAYNHGSGLAPGSLVRVVESASGTFASLEINQTGAPTGGWVTLAKLDGLRSGQTVQVVLDPSGPAAGVSVTAARPPEVASTDFYGTGTSDVLYRNTGTGEVDLWAIQNGQTTNPGPGGGVLGSLDPTQWEIAGTGDFYGAGIDDILLHNATSGQINIWEMSNGQIVANTDLGPVDPTQWHIAGTGDFYGAGTDDILLRNSTNGQINIWEMSNGQMINNIDLGPVDPTQWQIAGTGDFYGNGTDDILLHNSMNGQINVWEMSNGQMINNIDLGPVDPTQWQVAGTGDFYGNGTDDILLHNSTNGQINIWEMSNGQMINNIDLGPVDPTQWQIAGTGDFYGNGTDDILLHNSTNGQINIWEMSNGHMINNTDLGNLDPTQWRTEQSGVDIVAAPSGRATLYAIAPHTEFNFSAGTFGNDTVVGFNDAEDTIELSHTLAGSFATIQADEHSANGGTLITFSGSQSIMLNGITPPSSLTAGNFEFV